MQFFRIFIQKVINMKRIAGLVCLWVVALSCSHSINNQLDTVESLIPDYPDSALITLQKVSTSSLKTKEQRARYALLTSQALDKNYIDIVDDSLISIATDYYRLKGPSTERMKANYYAGIVHMNAANYPGAIRDFELAEKDANTLNDYFYLGLINKNQANCFSSVLNNTYAREYWEKSIEAFRTAGKDVYLLYALQSLAINYINSNIFEPAKVILDEIQRYESSDRFKTECLFLQANIAVEEGRSTDAIRLYQSLPEKSFSVIDYEYYALALASDGQLAAADSCLKQVENKTLDPAAIAGMKRIKSKVLMKRRHFEEAYRCLEESNTIQDSVYRATLQQSLGAVQRDFYKTELQLEEERRKAEQQKKWYIVSAILVIFLSLLIIYKKRERRKRQRIEELMASLDEHKNALLQTRLDKVSLISDLFREKLWRMNQLASEYYSLNEAERKNVVFDQFKKHLKDLRENADNIQAIEDSLNEYCDGIMEKFRSEFPDIKGEKLRIVTLFFAGVDYPTIQLLSPTHSASSLKTLKSRLRAMITQSGALHSEFFIKQLEMKKGRSASQHMI